MIGFVHRVNKPAVGPENQVRRVFYSLANVNQLNGTIFRGKPPGSDALLRIRDVTSDVKELRFAFRGNQPGQGLVRQHGRAYGAYGNLLKESGPFHGISKERFSDGKIRGISSKEERRREEKRGRERKRG
jgi:hypothetical protein